MTNKLYVIGSNLVRGGNRLIDAANDRGWYRTPVVDGTVRVQLLIRTGSRIRIGWKLTSIGTERICFCFKRIGYKQTDRILSERNGF